MIYHRPSWVGFMLWLRYAFLSGKILMSQKEVIFKHLESPGTKAYTINEAKMLLNRTGFVKMQISVKLSPGDLLTIKARSQYQGFIYKVIWKIYPRWLVKLLGDRWGGCMLIEAKKPLN
jgi:hypothetical protein